MQNLLVRKQLKILNVWLATDFEGGRHQKRLDKFSDIENGKIINLMIDHLNILKYTIYINFC